MNFASAYLLVGALLFASCNEETSSAPSQVPTSEEASTVYSPESTFENVFYARVKEKDQWHFIDRNGKKCTSRPYQDVRDFSEGYAAVKLNDKWGFIDPTDKVVLPFQFANAWSFVNGVTEVIINGENKFIDKKGKFVDGKSSEPEAVSAFADNVTFYTRRSNPETGEVSVDGRMVGYKDTSDNVIIEALYESGGTFVAGLAPVQVLGNATEKQKDTETILSKKSEEEAHLLRQYGTGHDVKPGLWGYIDLKGSWLVEPRFQEAYEFHCVNSCDRPTTTNPKTN